jgi:hypothetical protein
MTESVDGVALALVDHQAVLEPGAPAPCTNTRSPAPILFSSVNSSVILLAAVA